jgi:hypothetical protein
VEDSAKSDHDMVCDDDVKIADPAHNRNIMIVAPNSETDFLINALIHVSAQFPQIGLQLLVRLQKYISSLEFPVCRASFQYHICYNGVGPVSPANLLVPCSWQVVPFALVQGQQAPSYLDCASKNCFAGS